MKMKNQSAHLLHVEVDLPVHLEAVHLDLPVVALLAHHAPGAHLGLPEAVHQSVAVHQAVDLQAVVLVDLRREAVLLVAVHQREVAHREAVLQAVAVAVHQREVVLLVAAHLAVVLADLRREAVLLVAAHQVLNVEGLQVQSAVRQSEIHNLD